MGVIRKQAGFQSILNYAGTVIGAIAVMWIYPLQLEAYGLAQFLIGTGQFLVPLVSLGTITLVVKFFPEVKSDNWKAGYLLNMLTMVTAGVVLCGAIVLLFNQQWGEGMRKLGFRDDFLFEYSWQLAFVTVVALYNNVFILHASNYKKIVVPAVFQNLLPKITLPPLVLLLHFGVISMGVFVWSWLGTFIVTFLGLVWYLMRIGAWNMQRQFSLITRDLARRMASFAWFAGGSMIGTNLVSRVDIVLIALLVDFQASGIYFIAIFLARIVQIPVAAISQIAAPIVADSWTNKDIPAIDNIYKKASLNLFLVGLFLFSFELLQAESLFSLSSNPERLTQAISVFVFLGLTRLVSMLTSVNYHVLVYSRYYRYELLFVLTSGILNIPLTYYLIKLYGIEGAAMATLIAISVLNVLRLTLIKVKIGILPFSKYTINLFVVAAFCVLYILFVPHFENAILDMLVHGLIFTGVFVLLAEKLKLTDDLKPFVFRILARVGIKLNGKEA